LLMDELLGEKLEVEEMKLVCECVHEGGRLNVNNVQLKEKRKMFEGSLDFSGVTVSSSTIRGLKNILLVIQELNQNNIRQTTRNRYRTPTPTKNAKKYRSCNDLFNVTSSDNERCEMCVRFGNSYVCKRCQLTNTQKRRRKMERNSMIIDIEAKLKRNSSFKCGSNASNLNKYSRSLLDLSCPGGDISRGMSLLNLENINNSNNESKTECGALKELTLKGSCVTNKIMVELISLVNSCHVERLYLMGNAESLGHPISNKIVDNFTSCIRANLTHVSLNDFHLGEYWMKRLCALVREKSMLQDIRLSVSCVHELSAESAMNLVQAAKSNILLENVELYCGIQPMVIMALFSFYVELLSKDERLHLLFL